MDEAESTDEEYGKCGEYKVVIGGNAQGAPSVERHSPSLYQLRACVIVRVI